MSIFYADRGGAPALQAEVDSNAAVNRYVAPDTLRLMRQTNGAFLGGDLTGDPRGDIAIDIQSARDASTQVASGSRATAFGINNTASGYYSSAFGYANEAGDSASAVGLVNIASGENSSAFGSGNESSGTSSLAFGNGNMASSTDSSAFGNSNIASASGSSAFGFDNIASGSGSSAFGFNSSASFGGSAFGYFNAASGNGSSSLGHRNTASGSDSSAFGYNNIASGENSSAFGFDSIASGNDSSAIGRRVQTTIDNTFESGFWGIISEVRVRLGSYRTDITGMSQFTVSEAVPTDGGAVNGSEPVGTLGRGSLSLEVIGGDLVAYFNNGGTIQSNNLGAFV